MTKSKEGAKLTPQQQKDPRNAKKAQESVSGKRLTPSKNTATTQKMTAKASSASRTTTKTSAPVQNKTARPAQASARQSASKRSTAPKQKIASPVATRTRRKRTRFEITDTVYRVRSGIDSTFLIIVLILLCFGTVMVFSSSYAFAESRFNNSTFFVKRQTIYAIMGVVALIFFSYIDYGILKRFAMPIFGVSYILLFCVFLPVIGKSEKGATRWVDLKIITFQPSDVMKFSLVLILALYFSYFIDKTKKFKYGILIPGCIIVAVCGATIIQKHISGTVILFLIGAVMILVSGASAKWLAGICATGASLVCVIVFFTDYASARVNAWLHPETVLQSGGWQPYQSLLAIGSGGIFGVGLGNSYQKHLYLPEPQNDFIFAIVCEELGLIGGLAVIALFIALVWRGLAIAKRAPDTFSSLLVTGIVAKTGIQALLNIAVVTSTIPTTGIALPFFSYGGTALIMQLAEMGIVLSVSRYSSQDKI